MSSLKFVGGYEKLLMREAGIVSLRIFRERRTLFMIVESDSSLALPDRFIDHALEEEWHRLTGECFSQGWRETSEIYQLQVHGSCSL